MTKNVFVRLKVITFCVAVSCLVLSVESRLLKEKRANEPKDTKGEVTNKPVKEDDNPLLAVPSTKTEVNETNSPSNGAPASVSVNSSTSAKSNPNNTLIKEENITPHSDTNVQLQKGESDPNSNSGGVVRISQESKFYPPGAALRGLYVFAGLSSVVMVYIAIKLIRLRRKRTRIRKYGLLANIDEVEMRPLGAEEDDEESTLFDANQHGQRSGQLGGR